MFSDDHLFAGMRLVVCVILYSLKTGEMKRFLYSSNVSLARSMLFRIYFLDRNAL